MKRNFQSLPVHTPMHNSHRLPLTSWIKNRTCLTNLSPLFTLGGAMAERAHLPDRIQTWPPNLFTFLSCILTQTTRLTPLPVHSTTRIIDIRVPGPVPSITLTVHGPEPSFRHLDLKPCSATRECRPVLQT